MTLNTLDGVVAIQKGDDSKIHGEIINALPDRYGDIFIVGGILLSLICNDVIGLLGLATMFLVILRSAGIIFLIWKYVCSFSLCSGRLRCFAE